jgi:uncharacterized membrane protein YgcG
MNVMGLEEYSQDNKINDSIHLIKADGTSGATKKKPTSTKPSEVKSTQKIKKTNTKTKKVPVATKKIEQKKIVIQNNTNKEIIKKHWADETINEFKQKEIIKGYNGEDVKPDNNITRAEFFTLVNRIFNFTNKEENNFKDVANGDWYEESILKAKSAGYIKGYSTDEGLIIKPNAPITREEAATIICRVFNLDELDSSAKNSFKDENEISSYAKNNIQILNSKKYISGYIDNTFKPKNKITRAEAFKMLSNVAGEIYNKQGTYSDTYEGNLIVNKKDINLKDSTIKGNLYLTEGIGEGEITLENVKVLGKTFINGGGENSIYAKNSDLNIVIVNKKNGKIRIVAQGKTNIKDLRAESDIKINVDKESKIEKLEIEDKVKKIDIKSEGKIENVKVKSKEVSMNGKKVEKGKTLKIEKNKIEVDGKKVDTVSGPSKKSSNKNNDSGGGSSHSGGSSQSGGSSPSEGSSQSGGNNQSGGSSHSVDEDNYNIINTKKSSIIETESVLYAVVVLAKGTVDEYNFYIDQDKVEMEKVNAEGTVLKTELKNRNTKEVKVVSKNSSGEEVFKFGDIEKPVALTDLLDSDIQIEGLEFKESDQNDGSIKNTVRLIINKDKSATFSSKIKYGDVDGVTGASLVKPSKDGQEISGSVEIPEGLKLILNKIDDKTLELKLQGNAKQHSKDKSYKLTIVILKDLFENTKNDFGGLKREIDLNFNNTIIENTTDKYEFIDSKKTKTIETESVLYAVVVLKKGNADEYEFYLDENKVQMQKVVTEGNVVKVELKNREAKNLKVKNKENGKEEIIVLN